MMEGINFDGVLCFGQVDWWYHNRTHFDLQIMREFSRNMPVLYVNSLGMRRPAPSEGKVFLSRLLNKGKSFLRGFKEVENGFFVFSPISIPGNTGAAWLGRILRGQIKIALHRAGIKKPLIWVGCPTAYFLLNFIKHDKMIYQRTDRYEDYTGVDVEYIKDIDRKLKARADITVFCSSLLYEKEKGNCHNSLFIEHGVDYDYFVSSGKNRNEPIDLAAIEKPRAVYVGGMEEGIFDNEFLLNVAGRLPEWNFVLVGDSTFADGWAENYNNVYLLGKRPYEEVGSYMASGDVLIMPWCQNEWIEVCNPIKLKEYLAVGKGVVSTPFYELKHYEDQVVCCNTPEEFAAAIVRLNARPPELEKQRSRVATITWEGQAKKIWETVTGSSGW